ncbi:MAG: leucyl/phenylalanyl-tRNA--protein transferase [Ectothiorhodospiraceae bacterium]|nr:leucyl/phenylalanyl-tRNA--protein transferase [Ectothiorhodospiraceae bacterium]
MRQQRLFWLSNDDRLHFPPVETALTQPNGLVAVGGDLSPERLVNAYRQGIFPWFEEDQPILWWSPDPRAVLYPDKLRVSRSLAKRIRNAGFRVTMDRAFRAVMEACAAPRRQSAGTWITTGMLDAYTRLHQQGLAHSVEVWDGDELVGGLYGVGLGAAFFGESMFSRRTDASKVALVWLVRHLQTEGARFIDCQVSSSHLATLGAVDIPRARFIRELDAALQQRPDGMGWTFDDGFHPLRAAEQESRA